MKLKNAAVGMCVEVKADKTDWISREEFEEGDLCLIDQIDTGGPQLRLVDLSGHYRGWLHVKDVRRCK